MRSLSKYWLGVESYENWKFDRANGFSFLGISDKKITLASGIKKGDILIMYVTKPKSAFADARTVTADGTYHERRARDYQLPLSTAIKTEPLLTLPVEHWVQYPSIAPKLSFVGNSPRNFSMRQSLRKLNDKDAEHLMKALEAARTVP